MPGYWDYNESTGQPVWVEDTPTPGNWNSPEYQSEPAPDYWGQGGRDWIDTSGNQEYGPVDQGRGWSIMRDQYNAVPTGAGGNVGYGPDSAPRNNTGVTPNPNPDPRGGGGGGGAPPPPDPYAWMAKFGGKDFVKLFLKKPGEKLKDYYARMGGDPVKTLIAKYQELEGMDPDMNMRTLAIGGLGLTGIIDPQSLEEIFSMPQSDYLGKLMKAGPSMAGLTRSKGFGGGMRNLTGNNWWSMSNSMKTWAPENAANAPTPPTPTV